MFKKTTAQQKIRKLRRRVRIIQGGTSSSKTFSILPLLITYACKIPKAEISVVAESIPHLKRGAVRDFIKIMEWTGNMNYNRWNKSSLTYTFQNGSFIEFFSADQPSKLRGARRDVLFVNECNNINFEAYTQLSIRTRKFIYLDYNPTFEFWAHTELIGSKDVDFLILTYKDNEALEQSIVTDIEKAKEKAKTSSYWANWWRVFGLGEIGSIQGVVFSNWELIDILPKEAELVGRGMDFGFTNDPTTIVDIYKYNQKYILDERLYRTGLTNIDIWKEFKRMDLDNSIITIADSAEPKSIAELSRLGMKVQGAIKGADSIKFGIQKMQQENFLITKRSVNLIKELRMYSWATDKEGNSLNKPIDDYNHCIDSVRMYFNSKPKAKAPRGRFL